jgi:glycosyltransferase involved in cell wall biosynthesis
MKGTVRTVLLTNIISPYRIPFFNLLSRSKDIELKVFYVAKQELNRSFDILSGFHLHLVNRTIHLNHGMTMRLYKFRPNVVIIGTDVLSTPISWFVLLYAKSRNIKIIRYESQHQYVVSKQGIKSFLYRKFYSFVDSFFVYSRLTKDYLIALGIEPRRITVGFNVGDTDFFSKNTRKYQSSEEYVRERARYPEVMFLFAGRLTKKKNIIGLLEVLKKYDYSDIGLFILGDGSLRNYTLNKYINFKNIKVFIEGFQQKNECIKYFSLADIFVSPTFLDRASIVTSEALFSGLFTIGSKYDGSSENFIRDGENGLIIDPLDRQEFEKAISQAYRMKKENRIDKDKIRTTMGEFTTVKYAKKLENLILKHFPR